MKKLINGVLFLSLTGIILIGCMKEDELSPQSSSTSHEIQDKRWGTNEKVHNGPQTQLLQFWQVNGKIRCYGPKGNCMVPPPTITASMQEDFDSFISAVETGTDSSIQAEFTSRQSFISTLMPSQLVTDVIDGDLTVELVSDSSAYFLKFMDGATIYRVTPFDR